MTAILSHAGAAPPPAPAHVAVIMDGNGRWAKARRLPRVAGYRQGAEALRTTIEAAVELGISYLTLYGFSLENWKRPERDIVDLMGLLRLYLRREIDELDDKGVRICFIGERERFADDIVDLLRAAERRTRANTRLHLTLALSYGGRQEIACAARRLAADVAQGRLRPDDIDVAAVDRYLATAPIPDPDLLIRTSGERRISNFLLWQSAYAEFVFLDTLWPDFSKADLEDAVREFHRRDRRFGATGR